MGAGLRTGGAKDKRFCSPNSRLMLHQPPGGLQGRASDIEIHVEEIRRNQERLNEVLTRHTGQAIGRLVRILTEIV